MAGQSENKTPFREYIGYVLAGISAFIDGNGDGADTASIHNELQDAPQRSIYLPFTFPVAVSYGFLYAVMAVITERELSQAYRKKGEKLKKLQDALFESKKDLKNKIQEEFNKLDSREQATDEAREIKDWLGDTGHLLPTPSNKILLKYLIKRHGVNRLDKEILRLIEAVTGLNYRTASFNKDLDKFLASSHRRKNPLRAIPKRIFEFISRFSLMASIAAYLLVLLAAVSIPVTWPFIAIIVGSGLTYWAINFIYHRYYNHPRKKQDKDIAKELGLEQILENPINNEPAQATTHVLKDKPPENSLHGSIKGNDPENSLSLSMSQKMRMGLNVTGSFILFLAGSVSGGMTLAYLADIFLATASIISFPILSGMVGAGLAAFSIYYWIKKRIREIQVESVLTKEVAARKLELKKSEGFQEDLQKNNQELLKEVIEIYNSSNHMDDRQRKKIIGLIEKSIGKNFSEDKENLFFDALAKDMGESNKDCVQEFKSKFLNKSGSDLVNANNPELNINRFKAFFKGLMNHALPLTGVITLALLTPVFLFGLQALLPISVIAGVIVAGYLLNKVASHYHQKKMTELKKEKIKYELMEYKYEKANETVPKPAVNQNSETGLPNIIMAEQVSSPTPKPENSSLPDEVSAHLTENGPVMMTQAAGDVTQSIEQTFSTDEVSETGLLAKSLSRILAGDKQYPPNAVPQSRDNEEIMTVQI
jgi:hypothetical protein